MQDDREDGRIEVADGQGAGLFGAAPSPAAAAATPYRVLARKYRPSSFDDLIGQEAMVRTLSNAFDLGRIHQAYILTGVRGVGKTTTARILARAFNYELPTGDGRPAVDGPTIHMAGFGAHCQAIMESRHVDVIEMDAASHTGIDDVREIIEGARYKPVMARFKVYIIDEVHMLSRQAFNGLLKTLEEPPDHVKFLFATTEIEKVPVTVRSRCQRFDLRRIDAGELSTFLATICAREKVAIEDEALALIARAAEGSVRDALSLLDQAIAHGPSADQIGAKGISAEALRAMLGLADRGRIIDLFDALMRGRIAEALTGLKDLYDGGADPTAIMVELAEFTHLVTRLKLAPESSEDSSITPEERKRGAEFAASLSMAVLTRTWQLLSKGLQEIKDSPRPLAAADMVLVRLAYAADLPTPDKALRKLASLTGDFSAPPRAGVAAPDRGDPVDRTQNLRAPAPRMISTGAGGSAAAPAEAPAEPSARLSSFADIVALAAKHRDIQMKLALERDVRLVRFQDGSIEFAPGPHASPQLAPMLMRKLQEWTGRRWLVAVSREAGRPSLKDEADAKAEAAMEGVRADPLVRRALELFPGAEIVAVRTAQEPAQPAASSESGEGDIGFADDFYAEVDL
ncbi:DNA polymerase III, subunits gamma and tau [Methylocella silvestris BL2]|uniref:DNA polymerase III subunit gamma/tau n=1 Tax=Methylocella silvestris (strain DSM 15510 / CIP 108128 / LMG 27833 / NCIMB 13906 / BL2) TaxID=395965 RepID=B8EP15_METSB|nr:DNA polymerase III subunit gamma/tau [Methylocella silvestris]ACK49253.1 DNA polymerase III, subunits gamma and tau [Methylocella silvestris BL2]